MHKTRLFLTSIGLLIMSSTSYGAPKFIHPGKGETKPLIQHADYKMPTAMDFDSQNRPYMIDMVPESGESLSDIYSVLTIRDGKWKRYSFLDNLNAVNHISVADRSPSSTREMYIDENDNFFAIVRVEENGDGSRYHLIFAKNIASSDFNGEFQVYEMPRGVSTIALEPRNSFNNTTQYPPMIHFSGGSAPAWPYTIEHDWSAKGFVPYSILSPKWDGNGNLDIGPSIKLSDRAGYVTLHSGGHGFAVTSGDKSFVAYMVHDSDPATDPNGNNAVYVATVDRETRSITTSPMLFDSKPDFADPHSTPTIAIDSSGTLHVQGGAHASSGFAYAKSVNPRNASAWTSPVEIGNSRTYSELFIDETNKMHSLFRTSAGGKYVLNYQVGNTSSGFGSGEGIPFADNPNCSSSYRIYYHTQHKDRVVEPGQKNRIYANWSALCGDNNNTSDGERILAFSEDNGRNWKIPTRADFVERIKGSQKNYFRIVNKLNGKCLDVPGNNSGAGNGTHLQTWACATNANDQIWVYDETTQQVQNSAYPHMCLDSTTQSPGNGSNVAIYNCIDHPNLRWVIDNGVLRNSSNNDYVITSLSDGDGGSVKQHTYTGDENQVWELRVENIASSWVDLRDKRSGKCLDVQYGNSSNGTKVHLWTCNGSNAQLWKYDPLKGNFQSKIAPNKCLDAPGGNVNNNTQMQIWDCAYYSDGSSHINQRFVYDSDETIRSMRHSQTQVLDSTGIDQGKPIVTHSFNGGSHQRWYGTVYGGKRPVSPWVMYKENATGRCLSVYGGEAKNGAKLHSFNCSSGWVAQRWKYDHANKRLISAINNGQFCADAPNTNNGNQMVIWQCQSGEHPNQSFEMRGREFVPYKMNDNKRMDVNANSVVQTWDNNDTNHQEWFAIR